MEAAARSIIERCAPRSPVTLNVTIASVALRLHFATTHMAELFSGSFAAATSGAATEAEGWDLYIAAGDEGAVAAELIPAAGISATQLFISSEIYVLWMGSLADTFYVVDIPHRRALCWFASARRVPAWERSRPFLPILQVIFDPTPWVAVHSAAIAWAERGLVLAGPGRAGKTSVALAALGAGWRFAGDDYVLLRTDSAPAVAPIYATARLRDDMFRYFRELEPARREISEEVGERRHELSLAQTPQGGQIGGAPLSAIFLLDRRGAAKPTFGPVSRSALLSTMAAAMAVATPGRGRVRTQKLLQLISRVTPRLFDPGSAFGPALQALADAVTR